MNMSVDNSDVSSDFCYMNSSTGFPIKNKNFINHTKKKGWNFYQHIFKGK